MGFLDIFKGKRPKLSVTADPAEPTPGGEVRVRVVVEGEIDKKARGGRAGIRCVNDYLTKEWDRQDDEWDTVWRAVSMHEDAQDLPLQAGEHEFTFRVPEGLPPESAEAVSWWAWANIDREGGFDAKASIRMPVRLPASAVPSEKRSIPPGKDGVGFEDLPASAGGNQPLEGVITVTPDEDVKTQAVKVKLSRHCRYHDDDHKLERNKDVVEVEVAGPQELAAGQTHQFPFSFVVPVNPGPTAQAPHSVVEWTITGIVARRMKLDLEQREPIVVYDGH
ncbi:MAG TPA: sporulation protein [Solirubrobacteraceae bacterium]|jgi:hypothetical protein